MKFQEIVLLLSTLFTITAYGQTEKGKFYVGANSNLNFSKSKTDIISTSGNNSQGISDTNKFSQLNINSEIGYFLLNNLTTGLSISYTSTNPEDSDKIIAYTVAPFAKYYFLKGRFKPFIRTSYGRGKIKDNFVTTIVDNGLTGFVNKIDTDIKALNIGGGLAFFINTNFSLELILNYRQIKFISEFSNTRRAQTDTVFGTNLGFSFFL
tara:strand:- start:4088 stop:4714 length:627 start_codon:yes stop_codon:yes gene_type:complete